MSMSILSAGGCDCDCDWDGPGMTSGMGMSSLAGEVVFVFVCGGGGGASVIVQCGGREEVVVEVEGARRGEIEDLDIGRGWCERVAGRWWDGVGVGVELAFPSPELGWRVCWRLERLALAPGHVGASGWSSEMCCEDDENLGLVFAWKEGFGWGLGWLWLWQ